MNPRRPTLRHIIIKKPKGKDDERKLKDSKRETVGYLQGSSHNAVS